MIDTVFAQKLRFYRKKSGLTQKALGEKAGIGQVTVANYENGSRFPGEETLVKLAGNLGLSLDMLFSQDFSSDMSVNEINDYSKEEFLDYLLRESFAYCLDYVTGWGRMKQLSLRDIFSEIFIPVLLETGNRWQRGDLSISEEHLVSERIRELLSIVSIKEIRTAEINAKKNTWIGFCAPSEKHDMVLLMMSQVLRQAGWNTFFLGPDLPVNDLIELCRNYQPDLITISVVMDIHLGGLDAYLQKIDQSRVVKCPLMICGESTKRFDTSNFTKVKFVSDSFDESLEYALNF